MLTMNRSAARARAVADLIPCCPGPGSMIRMSPKEQSSSVQRELPCRVWMEGVSQVNIYQAGRVLAISVCVPRLQSRNPSAASLLVLCWNQTTIVDTITCDVDIVVWACLCRMAVTEANDQQTSDLITLRTYTELGCSVRQP